MDVPALSALSSYSYQSVLSQTGRADQALSQALAASQSQAGDRSAQAPAKVGPVDPLVDLGRDATGQSSNLLATAPSAAQKNGAQAQLDALLGSSSSALLSASDSLPASAVSLTPASTEAMVRYAYDQSQNPTAASRQGMSSTQQFPMTSGLNLLA